MTKLNPTLSLIALAIILSHGINSTLADQCKPNEYVYGANEIIDQLLICSVSRMFDLSMVHQGDFIKNTSKTFVEHGFANKTTVLYAKLNGLWTTRRVKFIETGWKCETGKTTVNAVVEMDGLALDVIERVDIPLHRSQHKLAQHKPCKTLDLPLWLCRSTKQLFKTTRTWVNSAYFNVTLTQRSNQQKPYLEKLSLMFTCPETFKQKIVYSPSAMYVLSKYFGADGEGLIDRVKPKRAKRSEDPVSTTTTTKLTKVATATVNEQIKIVSESVIKHPVSFVSAQDGRSPASPPYHSTVNFITNKASETLEKSLQSCIQELDSDLSVLVNKTSFFQYKFVDTASHSQSQVADLINEETNKIECSNKLWVQNRIDLVEAAFNLGEQQHETNGNHEKRSQYMLKYPIDPNQLLNPYGYYHENADQMID